ncbi:hypothetical protein EJB05_22341 [Eragrostis curvula]|uniref:O-acyltransferase WSD1 C-terminal domain-containing protein n=1 Tax=Eragrostis curvula TaxID=38414 RepID=A0A5J9V5N6_9POAL|nr:hypothetical protein EJB05_22341 [Eragrostis curvula]
MWIYLAAPAKPCSSSNCDSQILRQQQLSATFNTTMSFSSMVGTAEKVEFYGHSIVDIAPTVYGHPHAHSGLH